MHQSALELSIDFIARGRAGTVEVSVRPNVDPAAIGCDASAAGFPVCQALVTFAGQGYDALLGWVQLVGTRASDGDELSFDIDPLRIYAGLDTPFAFHGLAPTLFDAPSRRRRNQYLDWLALSFLCLSPADPMDRQVLPVLGFSWGFVVDHGAVTIVGPRRLRPSELSPHVHLLRDQFPSWQFLEPE